MLIDCDTCTARGTGCGDCVVTVLLGAPPGCQGVDPVVIPLSARPRGGDEATAEAPAEAPAAAAEDVVLPRPGVVVEFDEVERRAVRALAEVGLVPPLRHQNGSQHGTQHGTQHGSRDDDASGGRRTG